MSKGMQKIFLLEDGRKLTTIQTTLHSWDIIEVPEIVFLTDKEKEKGMLLGYDLEKLLIVKQKLIEGLTPTEIEKREKVSRNSVYKYQKILSVKYTKIQIKDNENTVKAESVFLSMLINNELSIQSTIEVFILLFLFFIVVSMLVFKWKYDKYYNEQMIHKAEASRVHLLFTTVFDLTYKKYPIFVSTEKEYNHYRKLLKHYNNQGRTVILLLRELTVSGLERSYTEKKMYNDFCMDNKKLIYQSEMTAREIWDKLEEKGFFDYWKTPKGEQWEKSKEYLYNAISFYQANQDYLKDDARKKHIIDDLIFEELN